LFVSVVTKGTFVVYIVRKLLLLKYHKKVLKKREKEKENIVYQNAFLSNRFLNRILFPNRFLVDVHRINGFNPL